MKYVIVDIDGTIAQPRERLKYLNITPPDWDSFYNDCFNDEPITEIIDMVNLLLTDSNYQIIFCTGRRESVRELTFAWMSKYLYSDKPFNLLMRPNKDHRHDTKVKPELLNRINIRPENTAFILEDRNSMVKKWRELGFKCLQVADGDF